ncbi:MAG: UPF0175 family protein [Acidobacteria bacterium]|nr:UPF0175 family protein [Acidobacteriota bacterium]
MVATVEIPDSIAEQLAPDSAALSRAALEALVLEGIRSGKISEYEGRIALGIESRYEMDGFLKSHQVFPELTWEDLEQDRLSAERFANAWLSSPIPRP